MQLNLNDAKAIISRAIQRATQLNLCISVVVVDRSGHLVAMNRMDNSPLMSAEMAFGKAYTAVGMGTDTTSWEDLTRDLQGFGGAITSIHRFVPFGGGTPIAYQGTLIGAVGVSGGSSAEDSDISKVASSALERDIPG